MSNRYFGNMHFSIPDTQEYVESTGTTYTVYNIYINGMFFCSLRYKQLHCLHEQLRRCCIEMNVQLPIFPPKRLLPLTNGQLESRRAALEHYLQLVGQDAQISKMEFFQNFLFNAQHGTAIAEGVLNESASLAREKKLEVCLMNGYHLQVNFHIQDNATGLLKKVCQDMQLPTLMMPYFCLYLMRKESDETVVLLRRLMDFESPYISQLHANPCQILLRTGYWNPVYDMKLLQNSIALNLLFIQTVSDMEREWIIAPPDVRQKLNSLKEHDMRKEYLEMARQLPLYGCIQFSLALIDYPEPVTSALISIGNKELSMRTAKGSKIYETKFRVTRMRCWRVTALHNTQESKDAPPSNLQLSFEYLMSNKILRWITITSPQSMLMSVCLQAMVDELLTYNKQVLGSIANSAADSNSPISHITRNGRPSQSTISSSSSTPSLFNENTTSLISTSSSTSSPTAPVKFLSQRRSKNPKIPSSRSYSAVFFRNAQEPVHNEAFEGIGDDDL